MKTLRSANFHHKPHGQWKYITKSIVDNGKRTPVFGYVVNRACGDWLATLPGRQIKPAVVWAAHAEPDRSRDCAVIWCGQCAVGDKAETLRQTKPADQ
jgi:hypothetical protein